jgi:diguanylate cyclase (GGDEF)-like protein
MRGRLGDWLFTADPRRRAGLQQAALAMALMALSVAVLVYAAGVAGTPPRQVTAWAVVSLGGMALMWALIRSGVTRRSPDPLLTVPQMVFAITSAAVAYTLCGPLRGVTIPVLMVILMFGMFRLRARAVGAVSLYALALFGGVMAYQVSRAPQVFVPAVELGHFAVLAAMLPAVSMLAARLAHLRERDRRQRRDLTQALARIQDLATRDELTGLVNRRHMALLLEQERQRGARSGRLFALAMLDIDHFKAVNDQHGHAVGDEVLRNLARQMPQALRSTDVVARWGGEEFIVLMPESALGTARTALERLRGRVAATPMAHLAGVPIRITVSAGLTEHMAGESVQQTLERADRALYEAKSLGRNQTVIA